jgi:hypothetical protein
MRRSRGPELKHRKVRVATAAPQVRGIFDLRRSEVRLPDRQEHEHRLVRGAELEKTEGLRIATYRKNEA